MGLIGHARVSTAERGQVLDADAVDWPGRSRIREGHDRMVAGRFVEHVAEDHDRAAGAREGDTVEIGTFRFEYYEDEN